MTDDSFGGLRDKIRLSFYFFIAILVIGPLGYRLILGDKYPLFDYFYMTVITVATVGYGEIVDLSGNTAGRVFTIFLIFGGMSVILYFFTNITAFLIEGDIKEVFWRKKMQKFIDSMKGHYIICGAGLHGIYIAEELAATKRSAVLIDADAEKIKSLKERLVGVGLFAGDATESDTLMSAGIVRASGLITATGNDKDNLVITITARQAAPAIRIVARCDDMKNFDKLKRAGADSVISSDYIGGLRMVSDMIRPTVVTFLDQMLRDREKNIRVEEIGIPGRSRIAGKPASAVKRQALLLAVKDGEGRFVYNPPEDFVLKEGHSLIFMGTPEERLRLEEEIRPFS